MNDNDRLKYLRAARELTGSTDIDILIETAKKIESFAQNTILEPKKTFEDFAQTLDIYGPDQGLIPFVPYKFQVDLVNTIETNKRVVISSARQMGITTTLSAYAVWNAARSWRSVAFFDTSYARARDSVECCASMIENNSLLYANVKKRRKGYIELHNGSKISAHSVMSQSHRGRAFTDVILQNAAYIPFSQESFWDCFYPTMASGSHVIMQSTPNLAKGLFHNIWNTAQRGENDFVPVALPWYAHPERDSEWANRFREMMSEVQFGSDYELKFRPVDE